MAQPTEDPTEVSMVDPRAPRFGQLVTMTGLGLGVVLREPALILAIAVILGVAVLTGWRIDLYSVIWVHLVVPVVGEPRDSETAAPHRFAKLMGASFSTLAAILVYVGPVIGPGIFEFTGYVLATIVACLAAIGGIGDYCIGCKMYAEVAYFRRLGML